MDEAFLALHTLLPDLLPLTEPLHDELAGVRQIITGCEVETPIELDLTMRTGSDGRERVEIGAAPPLYHLEVSELPVFHAVRIVVTSEARHG
ncbi:hypothetical protein [Microbacterium sp. 2FI]|uniref:hypothetical protein n=1 Tax=Microbacterium sp. 2FI TaxID=2502193 RepID=UPI0010F6DE78|nr:hypothetical protein [Microbacterium sp. 2FI]